MDAVSVLASVAGCVVSVGVIYRGVVRPVYRWATRLEKAVAHVELNMKNNGGSSLRDAVDRIENRLTQLEKVITPPKPKAPRATKK
jgi:hypothetical protein